MNKLIGKFINTNGRVLDLGCGDGSLLAFLKENNQVKGLGLEIDHQKIMLGAPSATDYSIGLFGCTLKLYENIIKTEMMRP